jgi:hypothetical protein
MDKIKALLEKAGCNPELTDSICESLESYKTTLRDQLDKEYAAKVQEAKDVCIEETEAHKRELARRLQIFCETKGAAIESTLAKQSALNESEALAKLRDVQSLLSGVEPNGTPNGNATAAIKKAQQQMKVANEARQKAEATSNRQTAIAEKALKSNRKLAAQLQKLQTEGNRSRKAVTEGKKGGKQRRRIDQGRSKAAPAKTSRATLVENQDRRPPARPQRPESAKVFGVDQIAQDMESDLI